MEPTPVSPLDITNLVLAVVGLVLAVASLGWQAATFVLAGARVRVELRVGGVRDGRFMHMPAASFTRDPSSLTKQGPMDYRVFAVVRNVGRTPVNVEQYSLTGDSWSYGTTSPERWEKPLPHRLEPGTSEMWSLPLPDAEALSGLLRDQGRSPRVYAGVELATGKKVRSTDYLAFDATV